MTHTNELDRIIRSVIAGVYDAGGLPMPVIPTLVALVLDECQRAGLSLSRRAITNRVEDFVFGGANLPASNPEGVS